MCFTDDPVWDFEMHDRGRNRRLARLPVCADCDNHIQEETAYYINGEWVCKDCMSSYEREVLPE